MMVMNGPVIVPCAFWGCPWVQNETLLIVGSLFLFVNLLYFSSRSALYRQISSHQIRILRQLVRAFMHFSPTTT